MLLELEKCVLKNSIWCVCYFIIVGGRVVWKHVRTIYLYIYISKGTLLSPNSEPVHTYLCTNEPMRINKTMYTHSQQPLCCWSILLCNSTNHSLSNSLVRCLCLWVRYLTSAGSSFKSVWLGTDLLLSNLLVQSLWVGSFTPQKQEAGGPKSKWVWSGNTTITLHTNPRHREAEP